ncbi:MAG: tyrosine-type recombinase/integrase [Pseudomonadota bacterium]|nr:tyrosine-type recombinase/integrase [Pseudomonadota bacterium]
MEITKLRDKTLQSIKPQVKRYRIYIKSHPGLFLLVNPSGRISFQYRFQLAGRRREISLGVYPNTKYKTLLASYAKAVKAVDNNVDPLAVKEAEQDEDNPTTAELAKRFLERYAGRKLRETTAKEYERLLNKHVLPKWKNRKAEDIKRSHVVSLVEKMAAKTPIQANRTLAVIKSMFTYGVKVGLLESSPAAGVSLPGKERIKDRVLTLDEITIMLKALEEAPRDARDILLLILLSGQRPGEVCSMHESQLNGDWWNMAGAETKSGRAHRVYLSRWTREIIQNRQDDGLTKDGYFFPGGVSRPHIRTDNLKNWFHRRLHKLFKEAGIAEPFTAHDLRRSAATGMAMLGHAAVVPDILNHAPQGITRTVYDRYDRGPEIKRALQAWEHAVKHAVEGIKEGTVIPVDFQ